ncbi:thioesterase II family protein [Streptomyces sp. NBC_01465]|uniref:thioesterase II family protein n=1 Tax=Streptomyces sp. NBC_01465 TaxID=2903878 RepID=UPI002E364862|nr:alpha/beta fold hydrolase [Streptomyces sp. NBC_01465]
MSERTSGTPRRPSSRAALTKVWKPSPAPAARGYAFAHAGAGALKLRSLALAAPDWMEIVAIRLPGREGRLHEPPLVDLDHAVGTVGHAIAAADDGGCPIFLFGACAGAVLAFETATLLAREGRAAGLIVTSRSAPHLPVAAAPPDDETALEELVALGGIPSALLSSPPALALLTSALRADQKLVDGYHRPAQARCHLPVLALYGADDPLLSAEQLQPWQEHTTAVTQVTEVPGGHFLLDDSPQQLAAAIGAFTAPLLSGAGARRTTGDHQERLSATRGTPRSS